MDPSPPQSPFPAAEAWKPMATGPQRHTDPASPASTPTDPRIAEAQAAAAALEDLADLFLTGPAPFQLPPKPVEVQAAAPHKPVGPPPDPREHSPVAFRFPRSSRSSKSPQADPPPLAVEAVLLGNLPGIAGPWLTQYAQRLAEHDDQPVLVLHAGGKTMELERIDPERGAPPRSVRQGPGAERQSLARIVEQLRLEESPNAVGRLLVCVDPSDAKSAAPWLADLPRWTVICGADDAAVVGAYAMLRKLDDAGAQAKGRALGVVIAGSPGQAADAAIDRIQRTASEHLQASILGLGALSRMGPVRVRQLGRFPATDWPAVQCQFATEPAPAVTLKLHIDNAPNEQPDPHAGDEPRESPDPQPQKREPEARRQPEPQPWSEPVFAPAHQPQQLQAPKPQPTQPAAASTTPDPQPPTPDPSLSTHLMAGGAMLEGGIALDAKVPGLPEVEMVLDEDGRLHLIGRHHGEPRKHAKATLRAAILELIEAQAWTVQNAQLLRLTRRQCQFDFDTPPALHLMTDRPDLATALATRIGDRLHLHLLQEVKVGPHTTWCCVRLT